VVAGHELTRMSSREQTRYLRRVIGFVWQQTSRNLLPYLTAAENVALPMVLDGVGAGERRRIVLELLDQVGLADRADHRPDAMSGGEQQRVAIAVALANRPEVILADEPTGELDSTTAHEVFDLFRRLNRELGVTIVVATHDTLVSERVDRTVAIRDGRVSSEVLRHTTVSEAGGDEVHATEYAVLDRALLDNEIEFRVCDAADNFEMLFDFCDGTRMEIVDIRMYSPMYKDHAFTFAFFAAAACLLYWLWARGKLTAERRGVLILMAVAVSSASAHPYSASVQMEAVGRLASAAIPPRAGSRPRRPWPPMRRCGAPGSPADGPWRAGRAGAHRLH
jgi:ABC-type lipoprotein export system ATPase subunit